MGRSRSGEKVGSTDRVRTTGERSGGGGGGGSGGSRRGG